MENSELEETHKDHWVQNFLEFYNLAALFVQCFPANEYHLQK